jgi:phosphoglycolate phosphatase-like HAD superfamily hydrolase
MSTPTLLLFDIDGTLILSGGAGVRGLNRALEQLYGVPGALDGVAIGGRTDRAIVTDVLIRFGREPTDEAIGALRAAYLDCLAEEIVRTPSGTHGVLPGVGALLDALERRADVRLGLLTGNFERGARIKLDHFVLWDRFAFGAFGDDHVDRRALVPVALSSARAAGLDVGDTPDVVIIGDTPLDVDCAQAHGAHAIGVTTGPYPRADLEAAGADLVLSTLEETEAFLRWLDVDRKAGG